MTRHSRQTRLAEVGEAGQARIGRARVEVRAGGLAAQVAVRYLAGAGVGAIVVRDPALAVEARSVDPCARVEVDPALAEDAREPALGLGDAAAREVALGASIALEAIRAALREDRA